MEYRCFLDDKTEIGNCDDNVIFTQYVDNREKNHFSAKIRIAPTWYGGDPMPRGGRRNAHNGVNSCVITLISTHLL